MAKPKTFCGNCGQSTTFGEMAENNRVKMGWCGACFKQSQRKAMAKDGATYWTGERVTLDGPTGRFNFGSIVPIQPPKDELLEIQRRRRKRQQQYHHSGAADEKQFYELYSAVFNAKKISANIENTQTWKDFCIVSDRRREREAAQILDDAADKKREDELMPDPILQQISSEAVWLSFELYLVAKSRKVSEMPGADPTKIYLTCFSCGGEVAKPPAVCTGCGAAIAEKRSLQFPERHSYRGDEDFFVSDVEDE